MITSRDVLDYIDWIWHCEWVNSICDGTETAMAAFDCFQRSPAAERGRSVVVVVT